MVFHKNGFHEKTFCSTLPLNCSNLGSRLKEKWLTQWRLPMCCRLDIRKCLEESIKWHSHGSIRQFTEQEVFYNCLMKDIIENLQLKKPIGKNQ